MIHRLRRKALKLLENPGALLFKRGAEWLPRTTAMPGSYDAEYLYLIQQHSRLRLSNSFLRLKGSSIVSWPIGVARVLLFYVQLRITNAIVQSLLNEQKLETELKERPNGTPQQR